MGDQLVLLLERVPGTNLAEFAAGRPIALESFWHIATQITDILGRTHAARVIHRDIKPANIMVDGEGRATILDFGLAQLTEASRLTRADQTVGTAAP